ncbi:MAG: hypothetical protein AB7I41_11240 [Candidatus Sericytochromatia bacterium]
MKHKILSTPMKRIIARTAIAASILMASTACVDRSAPPATMLKDITPQRTTMKAGVLKTLDFSRSGSNVPVKTVGVRFSNVSEAGFSKKSQSELFLFAKITVQNQNNEQISITEPLTQGIGEFTLKANRGDTLTLGIEIFESTQFDSKEPLDGSLIGYGSKTVLIDEQQEIFLPIENIASDDERRDINGKIDFQKTQPLRQDLALIPSNSQPIPSSTESSQPAQVSPPPILAALNTTSTINAVASFSVISSGVTWSSSNPNNPGIYFSRLMENNMFSQGVLLPIPRQIIAPELRYKVISDSVTGDIPLVFTDQHQNLWAMVLNPTTLKPYTTAPFRVSGSAVKTDSFVLTGNNGLYSVLYHKKINGESEVTQQSFSLTGPSGNENSFGLNTTFYYNKLIGATKNERSSVQALVAREDKSSIGDKLNRLVDIWQINSFTNSSTNPPVPDPQFSSSEFGGISSNDSGLVVVAAEVFNGNDTDLKFKVTPDATKPGYVFGGDFVHNAEFSKGDQTFKSMDVSESFVSILYNSEGNPLRQNGLYLERFNLKRNNNRIGQSLFLANAIDGQVLIRENEKRLIIVLKNRANQIEVKNLTIDDSNFPQEISVSPGNEQMEVDFPPPALNDVTLPPTESFMPENTPPVTDNSSSSVQVLAPSSQSAPSSGNTSSIGFPQIVVTEASSTATSIGLSLTSRLRVDSSKLMVQWQSTDGVTLPPGPGVVEYLINGHLFKTAGYLSGDGVFSKPVVDLDISGLKSGSYNVMVRLKTASGTLIMATDARSPLSFKIL